MLLLLTGVWECKCVLHVHCGRERDSHAQGMLSEHQERAWHCVHRWHKGKIMSIKGDKFYLRDTIIYNQEKGTGFNFVIYSKPAQGLAFSKHPEKVLAPL